MKIDAGWLEKRLLATLYQSGQPGPIARFARLRISNLGESASVWPDWARLGPIEKLARLAQLSMLPDWPDWETGPIGPILRLLAIDPIGPIEKLARLARLARWRCPPNQ